MGELLFEENSCFWQDSLMFPILAGLILATATLSVGDPPKQQPPVLLSTSPDGTVILRRTQADSGERGEARKSLELCTAEGKVLFSWISALGATSTFWSPDSRYVAINDMPGDGGDTLRLFSIDAQKPEIKVMREPDGKKLRREIESRHGSFLSTVEKAGIRAMEWKEGNLWCTVTGSFSPKRDPSLRVPFHHLWVFRITGEDGPVLLREWTLTDPKEHPERQP